MSKKRMSILSTAFMLLLSAGFTACGESGEESSSNSSISSSPSNITLGYEGGSTTITVTANREWSAYTNDDWISLESDYLNPSTGIVSTTETTATITVVVAANSGDAREGSVILKAGSSRTTVVVSQDESPTAEITCPLDGYELVWHDEFDSGSVPDDAYWVHEVQSAGWVNNELQAYVDGTTPNGIRVSEISGGTLKINCVKESGRIYSARLYANKKTGWKYGYFEASIKFPSGKGTWPAFWMMPVNYTSWPADGEIDIVEEVGYNPGYCHSTIHCNKYNNTGTSTETVKNRITTAESEFHTYALEWTSSYMTFYHDGTAVLTYKNDGTGTDAWPFDNAFYIILNLAWGGDWGGASGVDESALPATLEVDYVRVFQTSR